ncbi:MULTISPECIES: hypothetical protein [Blautia]
MIFQTRSREIAKSNKQ